MTDYVDCPVSISVGTDFVRFCRPEKVDKVAQNGGGGNWGKARIEKFFFFPPPPPLSSCHHLSSFGLPPPPLSGDDVIYEQPLKSNFPMTILSLLFVICHFRAR